MGNLLCVWCGIENLTMMEFSGLNGLVGEPTNVVNWAVKLALSELHNHITSQIQEVFCPKLYE